MPFILIFVPLLVRWILFAVLTLIPPVLMKWGPAKGAALVPGMPRNEDCPSFSEAPRSGHPAAGSPS